jgi:hypothetical protein
MLDSSQGDTGALWVREQTSLFQTGVAFMKIKTYRYLIGALVVAATGAGSMSLASAQSCQELWVERNSYYKDAGYCFKTDRAISYFGNQGCMYYDEARLPLPRGIRARIAEIIWLERRNGCN